MTRLLTRLEKLERVKPTPGLVRILWPHELPDAYVPTENDIILEWGDESRQPEREKDHAK